MLLEQAFNKQHSPFSSEIRHIGCGHDNTYTTHKYSTTSIQQFLELLLKFLFQSSWSGWICATSVSTHVDEQEIEEFQAY